jgi:Ca2+-binding EF-hand superfamily protein
LTEAANKKSDYLITNAKKVQLAKIFDRLDNDNDGEISTGAINIRALDNNLLFIFKPLI